MRQIEAALPGIRLRLSDEFGVPGDREGSVCVRRARLGDAAPQTSECTASDGSEEGGCVGKVCYAG